jgi:hypothetical protein
MRKVILLAASALLVPGTASAEGYVAGSYQSVDDGSNSVDALAGRILVTENIMLDGGFASADGLVLSGQREDFWQVGAHVFGRGEKWLLGGYVGYNYYDLDAPFHFEDWTLAGEGQYYLDRVTLGAAVIYSIGKGLNPSTDFKSWTVSGDVRFFVTDNIALHGTASWGKVTEFSDDGTAFGFGVEYQFDSAPISIFAGYRTTDITDSNGKDTRGIGLRWNFGEGTLIQRDRTGARLARPVGMLEESLVNIQPQ